MQGVSTRRIETIQVPSTQHQRPKIKPNTKSKPDKSREATQTRTEKRAGHGLRSEPDNGCWSLTRPTTPGQKKLAPWGPGGSPPRAAKAGRWPKATEQAGRLGATRSTSLGVTGSGPPSEGYAVRVDSAATGGRRFDFLSIT